MNKNVFMGVCAASLILIGASDAFDRHGHAEGLSLTQDYALSSTLTASAARAPNGETPAETLAQ